MYTNVGVVEELLPVVSLTKKGLMSHEMAYKTQIKDISSSGTNEIYKILQSNNKENAICNIFGSSCESVFVLIDYNNTEHAIFSARKMTNQNPGFRLFTDNKNSLFIELHAWHTDTFVLHSRSSEIQLLIERVDISLDNLEQITIE